MSGGIIRKWMTDDDADHYEGFSSFSEALMELIRNQFTRIE